MRIVLKYSGPPKNLRESHTKRVFHTTWNLFFYKGSFLISMKYLPANVVSLFRATAVCMRERSTFVHMSRLVTVKPEALNTVTTV